MGQKTSPISTRLYGNCWPESCWYSDANTFSLFYQELNQKQFFDSVMPPTGRKFGFRPARVVCHQFPKKNYIHLFFLRRNLRLRLRYNKRRRVFRFAKHLNKKTSRFQSKGLRLPINKRLSVIDVITIYYLYIQKNMLLAKVLPFANYAKQLRKKLLKSKSFLNPSKKSGLLAATMLGLRSNKAPWNSLSTQKKHRYFSENGDKSWATQTAPKTNKMGGVSPPKSLSSKRSAMTDDSVPKKERFASTPLGSGCTPQVRLTSHPGEPRVGSSAWWAQLTALARAVREQEHSQKGVEHSEAQECHLVPLSGTKPYSQGGVRGGGHSVSRFATKDSLFVAKPHPSSLPRLGYKSLSLLKSCSFASKRPYNTHMSELLRFTSSSNAFIVPFKLDSMMVSASLIATHICSLLQQKRRFKSICKWLFKDIAKYEAIKGVRISCSGRLNGKAIARTDLRKLGETSLHTFKKKIDYAQSMAITRHGVLGIKVWVSYSPKGGVQN
jgi:hypothetical protein